MFLSKTHQAKDAHSNLSFANSVLSKKNKLPAVPPFQMMPEDEPLQGKFEAAQMKGPEEEDTLQGKFETVQKKELDEEEPLQKKGAEEEEPLQGKFASFQMKSAEEEDPLQGKFEVVQKKQLDEEEPLQKKPAEEEEPLQGKFTPVQMKSPEDEESLQGKFEPVQKKELEEKEPVQGKFTLPSTGYKKTTEPDKKNAAALTAFTPVQAKANNTGMPAHLKAGIENLSGYSLDSVKVHYNSDKPSQLKAYAFAQGTDIHLAPGQEKHLPHEAWHVVQQMQGRVQPTMQMKGNVNVNDDADLETEADLMGAKATQSVADRPRHIPRRIDDPAKNATETALVPLKIAAAQNLVQALFWEETLADKKIWHYGPVIEAYWEDTGREYAAKKSEKRYGVWKRKSELREAIIKYCSSGTQADQLIGIAPGYADLLSILENIQQIEKFLPKPKKTPGHRLSVLTGLLDLQQEYDTSDPANVQRRDVRRPGTASTKVLGSFVGKNAHDELKFALIAAYSETVDHGHSLHRHGPHLSDEQLTRRITEGVAADEATSFTDKSTRFSSFEGWVKAQKTAKETVLLNEGNVIKKFIRDKADAKKNLPIYKNIFQLYKGLEQDIRNMEQQVEAARPEANQNYLDDYQQADFYDPVVPVVFDITESKIEVDNEQFQREKLKFDLDYAAFIALKNKWQEKIDKMKDGSLNKTPNIPPRPSRPNPPSDPPSLSLKKICDHKNQKYAHNGIGIGFEADTTSASRQVPNPLKPNDRASDGTVYEKANKVAAKFTNTVITLETTDGINWSMVQFFPTTDPADYTI